MEHLLTGRAPILTASERDALWGKIEENLTIKTPILSPFNFRLRNVKVLTSLVLTLLLVVVGGGTTYASATALPGDLLFPVERTFENARLLLTLSDNSKKELMAHYADERLMELRTIINEESMDVVSDTLSEETSASSATDTEAWKDKRVLERKLSKRGEARVGVAVDAILSYLDEVHMDEEGRTRVLEHVFGEINGLALDVQVNDSSDDDPDEGRAGAEVHHDEEGVSSIEIHKGKDRIRVEEENGKVQVRTEEHTDDDTVTQPTEIKTKDDKGDDSGSSEDTDRDRNGASISSWKGNDNSGRKDDLKKKDSGQNVDDNGKNQREASDHSGGRDEGSEQEDEDDD